ncbi:MAG: helix-turn-helix domain-containing protein [Acidobacteriia bacterium]|nr:helix-turn-helix domain-containing protein [Terriglobia bacterium]MYC66303.1 helix-turn-helix domain-containing protein [Terriglobia bacterium]
MRQRLYSPSVRRALRELGRDIRIARKKRRMPVADFAVRMGVSQGTLLRLEKGDPGVAIGAVAMALLALGELHRLGTIIDISTDDTGLMLDVGSLPQRIRRPKALILAREGIAEGNE